MRYYNGENITNVFEEILEDLLNNPDYIVYPRGMQVKEISDCSIEIENPLLNIYKNEFRSSPLKYIAAEILWYFSGTNNPSYIENYASLWKKIHNPDGTVNSSYGNLLFTEKNKHNLTQYQWVIETLKKDKDSRQAFMHFNKPKHQWLENKDQVCTLQALFRIREDIYHKQKLHMTITMRSNDVIYGFMTDWAFFSILHYHVFLHLKKYYPNLEVGSYTHISHSMHLYERHYDLVKKMITEPYNKRCDFIPDSLPLLSETLLYEDGSLKERYNNIMLPIRNGRIPNYNIVTGNDLIDWCLNILK